MNPNILGVIGPGFLNQVPALGFRVQGLGSSRMNMFMRHLCVYICTYKDIYIYTHRD